MSTATRIYVVRNTIAAVDADTGKPLTRLVRAPNVAQAVRHVAADTLQAAVATQDDLIECLSAGIKVEVPGGQAEDGVPE